MHISLHESIVSHLEIFGIQKVISEYFGNRKHGHSPKAVVC